jgi:hypothetical protein
MLPERVPLATYSDVGAVLRWPQFLVRALSRQEVAEDPRWIRLETSRWKRYRMASREAKAFDNARNSKVMGERWVQFSNMDKVCEADAAINPAARPAAMLSHSIGFGQILGENHKFAGHETVESFWQANLTMEGQARCFIAFALASPRLVDLGRRLDMGQRHITRKGKPHLLKHGDLSEISYIWNGPNYTANRHDDGLLAHFRFASKEGAGNVRVA